MSLVEDQYIECKRCKKNAVYSSFNCRTNEEYMFCTACGTSHNFVLKRDEEGKAILKRDDYEIDGKISFVKLDSSNQLIESTPITETVTNEYIKEWCKKDSYASIARFMHKEDADPNSYIIAIVNDDNSFTQIYGKIQIEDKDGKRIVFAEYYEYEEQYEEGFGVAKVFSENGVASLYAITNERTEEEIAELKKAAKDTDGYFTFWDKEKNELVVEFGELDVCDPCEDECACCCECEGSCHGHENEKEHECNCGGSCGGNCSCH